MTEDQNGKPELLLKFDPNTIDDLGAKLYSTLPPVLAELIANGYDAGGSEIHIELNDSNPRNKTISIIDNGVGMRFDEINDNYLVVGRKRRKENKLVDPNYDRPVMGKKGLGKLSFFGITDLAEVITRQKGVEISFEMDRIKIRSAKANGHKPVYTTTKSSKADGTIIRLNKIKRESNFDLNKIKNSIANYFIFDKNFKVFIKYNDMGYEEISNDTRYDQLDIQFSWQVPLDGIKYDEVIIGQIFTTKKPISKKKRGLALISRKKLVNLPELFPIDTSSYFYEYLTGYLEVDFIDDLPEDIISTDRKTLNWGHSSLTKFENWLEELTRFIEKKWREKRSAENKKNIGNSPKVKAKAKTVKTKKGKEDLDNKIAALAGADIDPDNAVEVIEKIVKDFPELHYKHLYPELQSVVEKSYEAGLYYTAVLEGVKRYVARVQNASKSTIKRELDLLSKVFGSDPDLCVTLKYESYETEAGNKFSDDTITSIKEGHSFLAKAIWKAFRNPVSHEEDIDLSKSGLYSVEDCLDALSLLSHLFRRLENATILNLE